MAETQISSGEQVKIISIILESDRMSQPIELFALNQDTVVAEFSIYEKIDSPFLTANMQFLDDVGLYQNVGIRGTERVTIEVASTGSQDEDVISKTFIITNVVSADKVNDYATMLTVSMIQDIGFFDRIQRFSKYYDGRGEQIIKKIVSDKLFSNVDTTNLKESFQAPFRYIVPYQTPLDAVQTVLRKMTTELGMPYFFFSTLNNDDFVLTDLETILNDQEQPFNKDYPFVFSQAKTNDTNDFRSLAFTMHNFESQNMEDTLFLAQTGALGSTYNNINITTGATRKTNIDMNSRIQTLVDNQFIPKEYSNIRIDTEFVPDPSGTNQNSINLYQSRIISELSASTFPYDKLNNFSEEENPIFHDVRIVRDNMLKFLTSNIFTAYLPGLSFLWKTNVNTVGSLINIQVFKNDIVDDARVINDVIDTKRSGNYLILAKRHLFNVSNDTHNVSIEISRITDVGTAI
jgi:hypothetical protein|tara:strand:- start:8254 stop:9639 length:1386 start_codon:yes stop_codon:yes gene_type:complete